MEKNLLQFCFISADINVYLNISEITISVKLNSSVLLLSEMRRHYYILYTILTLHSTSRSDFN